MLYELTRVSSKGQIVVPKRMRNRIGIKAGDHLVITSDGKNILLKILTAPEFTNLKRLIADTKDLMSSKAQPNNPHATPSGKIVLPHRDVMIVT